MHCYIKYFLLNLVCSLPLFLLAESEFTGTWSCISCESTVMLILNDDDSFHYTKDTDQYEGTWRVGNVGRSKAIIALNSENVKSVFRISSSQELELLVSYNPNIFFNKIEDSSEVKEIAIVESNLDLPKNASKNVSNKVSKDSKNIIALDASKDEKEQQSADVQSTEVKEKRNKLASRTKSNKQNKSNKSRNIRIGNSSDTDKKLILVSSMSRKEAVKKLVEADDKVIVYEPGVEKHIKRFNKLRIGADVESKMELYDTYKQVNPKGSVFLEGMDFPTSDFLISNF